jgi:phytoene dehydrogenase-like protein
MLDDISKLFQNNGGTMHCRQTVDKILTEKKKVKGVKTADGNYYYADRVVFTGAMKKLYTELLDPEYLDPEVVEEIRNAQYSEPLVSVYLGVDMTHAELSKYLKTHHTLFFPDGPVPDYDNLNNEKFHESSFLEINWTSMRCPNLAPENKNSLVLQSFTNSDWMERWGTGGDDFSRPEKYKKLKEMVTDQMIDTACKYIPGLKDKIVYKEAGTPMSTIRFTLNPNGASCGWKLELEKSFLKDRKIFMVTPYDGLYAAGHYALWPGGVPIAALSGVFAAELIKHDVSFKTLRGIYKLFK